MGTPWYETKAFERVGTLQAWDQMAMTMTLITTEGPIGGSHNITIIVIMVIIILNIVSMMIIISS